MDNEQWIDWVKEDATFKAENTAAHKLLTLYITELQQSQESILTNHLPHIHDSLNENKECSDKNVEAIFGLRDAVKNIRKWMRAVIVVGVLILLESDRIPQLLDIIKGFLR